jgi:hypothetical protein
MRRSDRVESDHARHVDPVSVVLRQGPAERHREGAQVSKREVEKEAASEERTLREADTAAIIKVPEEGEVSKITGAEESRAAKKAAKKAAQEAAKRERAEKAANLAALEKSMPKLSAILKAVPGHSGRTRKLPRALQVHRSH